MLDRGYSYFKERQFPRQDQPIYCFTIDPENGGLVCREYRKWIAIPQKTYNNKTVENYRIWTGGAIVTKSWQQMDAVLHKYLFTFNPDQARAMELFQQTYQKKLSDAQTALVRTQEVLDILNGIPHPKQTKED